MKEYIMQETEEMTTFGIVWKQYKPVSELVRCKDCRYSKDWNANTIKCIKTDDGSIMFHNKCWFCAYGEPKEQT